MLVGHTRWEQCEVCGRRFLMVVKSDQDCSQYSNLCPGCRAKETRKLIQNMTDKWLRGKILSQRTTEN